MRVDPPRSPGGPSARPSNAASYGSSSLPSWAANTLLFALALRLFLSPAVLNLFIPYTAPGGFLIFKIHPATYILVGLFAISFRHLGIARSAAGATQNAPYFIFSGLVALTGMVVALFGTPSGVGYLLDSLFSAAATALLCSRLSSRHARNVLLLVAGYAIINALSAYIEFATHRLILPLRGSAIFRSAGIAGHPLETGVWCILGLSSLYLLPGKTALRLVLGIALLGATATAGARLSMLICIFLVAMLAIVPSDHRVIAGARVLRAGLAAVVLSLVGPLAIAFANQVGVLARFNMLGLSDDSAASRILAYSVFRSFSLRDLMFGAPVQLAVDALYRSTRTTLIESSLVAYVFTFGVIGTALLLIGFLVIVAHQLATARRATPVILAFWVCAGGTLVLSGKSAGVIGYFAVCAAARHISGKTGPIKPRRARIRGPLHRETTRHPPQHLATSDTRPLDPHTIKWL